MPYRKKSAKRMKSGERLRTSVSVTKRNISRVDDLCAQLPERPDVIRLARTPCRADVLNLAIDIGLDELSKRVKGEPKS